MKLYLHGRRRGSEVRWRREDGYEAERLDYVSQMRRQGGRWDVERELERDVALERAVERELVI